MPRRVPSRFARFHSIPPIMQQKIKQYVDYTFSVTKGLNIETIASQLPSHLQLELYSQLNKRMVEQARHALAPQCAASAPRSCS